MTRGLASRFTSEPADDLEAIWSPAGRMVFNSARKGALDLYQKASSDAATEEVLLADSRAKYPMSWSPDGKMLLYLTSGGGTGNDLWVLPFAGERKPIPLLNTEFGEGPGQFSPDGRWIAYTSNESKRNEVYVAPFPGLRGKRRISVAGGNYPRWRHDGKEIFYIAPDDRLMAATVNGQSSSFQIGEVKPLFKVQFAGGRYSYDVWPDGQRFLVNVASEQDVSAPITLIVNWTAAFNK